MESPQALLESVEDSSAESSHWTDPHDRRMPPRPGPGRPGLVRPSLVRPGRTYAERRVGPKPVTVVTAEASDETLLVRLRRGDLAAGEALVARYYLPLMRYLQRIAGPRAAEDLHQQTWVSALAHADRFVANAGAGSFRGWLFRIASNKTKDHWRSARREKAAKEGFGRQRADEQSPWAGHAADVGDQREKMLAALGDLPNSQREVLLLRYYSDMRFADIADLLGCPLNTALTRAHKGLIKLREAMAREPVREGGGYAVREGRRESSARRG